jgi:hypothetical protein
MGPDCLSSHIQKYCSFFQLDHPGFLPDGASLSLLWCTGHRGVMRMQSIPGNSSYKVLRCNNCSGCKECRQPTPVVVPEGTGGSGCSAEVGAAAEALHAQPLHRTKQRQEQQSAGGTADSSTRSSEPAAGTSDAAPPVNPALVECATCHRKPGDPGVPATLKLCGGCQHTRYCSAECQKRDWKLGHKVVCQHLTSEGRSRRGAI